MYERSVATLVASWAYFAEGSRRAEVIEEGGAAIAVFPDPPQREVLNNTVLSRGLCDLESTLETVERTYAERGVDRYAVWAHESDGATASGLRARGFAYDSSTRTMAMPTADLADLDTSVLDLAEPSLAEFHRLHELEDGFFPELPGDVVRLYVARSGGVGAGGLMTVDHEGDCGIYIVGTAAPARRRGIATALTAHAVAEARERGCATASLQSTEVAKGVYARVGFRDLGRFDEYVPAERTTDVERLDVRPSESARAGPAC